MKKYVVLLLVTLGVTVGITVNLPVHAQTNSTETARTGESSIDDLVARYPDINLSELKRVQLFLKEKELYNSAVNGVDSPGTEEAVQRYRLRFHADTTGGVAEAISKRTAGSACANKKPTFHKFKVWYYGNDKLIDFLPGVDGAVYEFFDGESGVYALCFDSPVMDEIEDTPGMKILELSGPVLDDVATARILALYKVKLKGGGAMTTQKWRRFEEVKKLLNQRKRQGAIFVYNPRLKKV